MTWVMVNGDERERWRRDCDAFTEYPNIYRGEWIYRGIYLQRVSHRGEKRTKY